MQADLNGTQEWLGRVRLAPYQQPIVFKIECEDKQDVDPDHLVSLISALQAVTFADAETEGNAKVRVEDAPLAPSTVHALLSLPALACALEWWCDESTTPCSHEVYTELARCLPVSYTSVDVGSASERVREGLCTAIAEHRAELGLKMIPVTSESYY